MEIQKIGPYIHEIDIRNSQGKQSNLLGVSVNKTFIPSIANTIGTDWSKYKIIKKNQFCYIPDTSRRGDKIGIALLKDYDEALVSQAYTVFSVDETKILPDYLMLWFMRAEFDRYSRFHSHGSVREIFDWSKISNVELPLPTIKEQKEIIDEYNAISERIAVKEAINNNLLHMLDTDLKLFMLNKDKERITFLKYCKFLNGYAFKSDSYLEHGIYKILTIGNVQDGIIDYSNCNYINQIPKNIPKHCILSIGDILMSLTGYVGRIAIITKDNCLLNQRVCKIMPKNEIYSIGIIAMLRSNYIQEQINRMSDGGTAQHNLSTVDLEKLEFEFIKQNDFENFCLNHKSTLDYYLLNINEIDNLIKLKILLIERLTLKQ